LPFINIKYQKCGKKNCKCSGTSYVHGPYFWLVSYVRVHKKGRTNKLKWKYIGSNSEQLLDFLKLNESKYNFDPNKINELVEKHDKTVSKTDFSNRKSMSKKIELEELEFDF